MPTAAEIAATQGTALNAALRAGVSQLSLNQTIDFTRYVRFVLPIDGSVFWVRDDLVGPSALLNTTPLNKAAPNQAPRIETAARVVSVRGSFHYATSGSQDADESFATNSVIFTALSPIQNLNDESPEALFIGTFEGIRFAFSTRNSYYRQADLHHYRGDAVYPIMDTQLIDKLSGFDAVSSVVSNSLPLWLSLNARKQLYPFPATCPLTLYPAYLIPDNLPPAYGSINIESADTKALQAVPSIDYLTSSHDQLTTDRVRVVLYGLRNFNSLDFLDFVLNFIGYDGDPMGLMNTPIVRDEKRTQKELNVLAMKKSITFDVSYYQSTARHYAQQLILHALINFNLGD